MLLSISAPGVSRGGALGSATPVLGEPTIGAHTVGQSSGSISSGPSITRYGDGYWASFVFDEGFTIISSDMPPVRCPGSGECVLDLIELGGEVLDRVSSILGVGVKRIFMLCTTLLGRCSGFAIKIFAVGEPGDVARAFDRARGEIFRIMAETYGSI